MLLLRSLDLFSGVGGLTLALDDIASPLLYCERAPEAQAVLLRRMRDGGLPAAPVCKDVCDLERASPHLIRRDGGVDLVVGGFPCVGFSPIGKRRGFDDPGSALFSEIMRVVRACEPPLVFLENVPSIVSGGLHHVASALTACGYELRWCLAAASSVGAPHVRRRWFCLAHSPARVAERAASREQQEDVDDDEEKQPRRVAFPDWAREPPAASRMVPAGHPDARERAARLGLLGNAVVPDCARAAFLHLLQLFAQEDGSSGGVHALHSLERPAEADSWQGLQRLLAAPSPPPLPPATATNLPSNGWARACREEGGGGLEVAASPPPDLAGVRAPAVDHPARVYDAAAFRPAVPLSRMRTTALLEGRHEQLQWPTPRHGMTSACNCLTARSIRDLPTVVRFEVATLATARGGQLSAVYVEWMMGYRPDWTRGAGELPPGVQDDGLCLYWAL